MSEEWEIDTRALTLTWEDPFPVYEKAKGLSGYEYLQAMSDSKLPYSPIAKLLNLELDHVGEGAITITAQPGEQHYNPMGVVHGTFAAGLLDTVMGCAVHTTLAVGKYYSTLENKVNYVRSILISTGKVICEGRVIHRGGKIATAEGKLMSLDSGKLLAHGTTTCFIRSVD